MNDILRKLLRPLPAVLGVLLLALAMPARAVVDGVSATTFNLTAKADYISSGDGNTHFMWGYANAAGTMQYPGPTMIVPQGATVTVTLGNQLGVPVSIVFPGQQNVTASGGSAGVITREAPPAGTVTYTFVASEPGTYLYHSGTQQELQVEMGLIGALVVRPATAGRAYAHAGTAYDREYLFVLSEIDPAIHAQVETGQMAMVDNTTRHSTLYFMNGRNGPDTLLDAFVPWLPTQPYNALPRMHAGE
jgi:FtsP/CotA-like multicopper oxidase with cupredoxin domain